MSYAACKAVICEDQAQALLMSACETIEGVSGEDVDFRVKVSEVYINAMKSATKEIMKLID